MLKPVAVITCLEDSPPSFDRLLLGAYVRTIYQVAEPPGFSFQIGVEMPVVAENWLGRAGCRYWAFVTAWNPFSQPLPLAENRERNRQLAGDLAQAGWRRYSGLGIGPDKNWLPEESFWVLNMPPEQAIRLGKKFDQNALVWWEAGKPVALWLLV